MRFYGLGIKSQGVLLGFTQSCTESTKICILKGQRDCQWSVSFPIFRPTNVFENDNNYNKRTHTHKIGILFLIPFLIHSRTQHPFYCKGRRSYNNFFNFLNAHKCYINFHYYPFFLGLIFRAFQITYAPYSQLQIKQ